VATDTAKLVLGGINAGTDTSLANARGTLYSVKYWNQDLGEGECVQLANWCHETMTFAVSDYTAINPPVHSAINTTLNANIVLHTLNASSMGAISEPVVSRTSPPSTIGWGSSTIRNFYNNRIYLGLPITMQSIMSQMSVPYCEANLTEGGYILSNNAHEAHDYIFAPSVLEVGKVETSSPNHNIEAAGPFPWYSPQMKIRTYAAGSFGQATSDGTSQYTNLRFIYRKNDMNNTVTIYKDYPATGSSFYNYASNTLSTTL